MAIGREKGRSFFERAMGDSQTEHNAFGNGIGD
jgi:hypothetical protein